MSYTGRAMLFDQLSLTSIRATRRERRRPFPADGLIPHPMRAVMHAVSIGAPPQRVWPWLAQMGAGRAGWYSYDRVDNGGQPSATKIISDLHNLRPGDLMPAVPGATDAFVVEAASPYRRLFLTVPAPDEPRVTWEFLLEPLGRERSRLLVRSRVSTHWLAPAAADSPSDSGLLPIERFYALLARLPKPVMAVPATVGHRIMEGRMLRGIKRRAENQAQKAP